MRGEKLARLVVVILSSACSGGGSGPSIDQDVRGDVEAKNCEPSLETVSNELEMAQAGDHVCHGECGEVLEARAPECISSLDCPDDLVCAEALGLCVVCAGDEDCPENFECRADYECHELVPCSSDKSCKALGMVCDKEQGYCVECLVALDCPNEEFCADSICLPDVCGAGKMICEDKQTRYCLEDGSGWDDGELCAESEYCESGICHEQACYPEDIFCSGAALMKCDLQGTKAELLQDCAASQLVCKKDSCIAPACPPGQVYCKDDYTAASCSGDGMLETVLPCPAETFCEAGDCVPWVCPAGQEFCVGSIHKVCDGVGKSLLFEEDCAKAGMACTEVGCTEMACTPNLLFCATPFVAATCSGDGLSYQSTPCQPGMYCKAGQCLPQICTPSTAYCAGPVAFVCDEIGSAFLSETNCAELKLVCQAGKCTECIPNCAGKSCGPDGCFGNCGECFDSNDCTIDVCLNGQCKHEPTNGAVCKGAGICAGLCVGNKCTETAFEDCATPGDDNCNGLTNEINAKSCKTFYSDLDGDGFAGTQGCYCSEPPGGSAVKSDCCDQEADAFPGQTKYFDQPLSGCGGFDYNCSGAEEREEQKSCVVAPCAATGWFEVTPACGATGNFCANCLQCGTCVGTTTKKTQKCK
jgi:hypothetical protein